MACERQTLTLFDDTASAALTLWGSAAASAATWQPSRTVLLIERPGCHAERKDCVRLTADSLVYVDPDMRDAKWLRAFAQRRTIRDHVNPVFPETGASFSRLGRVADGV